MFTHRTLRAVLRVFAGLTTLSVGVALPLLVQPALADTPAAWPKDPHVSAMDFLLVLLIIPGAIAALIAVLVALPSMVRGESYQPGETWVGQDEWFGGPSKGIEAAGSAEKPSGEQGGAGAEF